MTKIDVWPLRLPLQRPFILSNETLSDAPVIIVRIGSGRWEGWGESGVSKRVLGEDLQGAFYSARQVGAAMLDSTIPPGAWEEQRHQIPSRAAATAFDMAVNDLWAHRFSTRFLPELPSHPRPVRSSITITAQSPTEVRQEAHMFWREGWQVFKLKIGAAPAKDIGRLAALRDATPLATIRVDANGGLDWDKFESLAPALDQHSVELIEQPFPEAEIDLYRQARSTGVPVFMDEGIGSREDVDAAARASVCDGVNLKLEKARGLLPLCEAIEAAEERGLQVMMGCFITSRLSHSALQRVVEAYPVVERVDLDGPLLLATDPIVGGSTINQGMLQQTPAVTIGHGASSNPEHLARWSVVVTRQSPPTVPLA